MATSVNKIYLKYNEISFDPLWLILDDQFSPPILPLLFTTYLSIYGEVFKSEEKFNFDCRNTRNVFTEKIVDEKTIKTYIYCLSKYLKYIDICSKEYSTPGVHSSSSCSNKFINHYINNVLPETLESPSSIEVHRSSLISYYNFLSYFGFRSLMKTKIYRKTRHKMSLKSNKELYIKYISRRSRFAVEEKCSTLCEKLIIRFGYEVGLRTSELVGIRVSGKNSIVGLFEELEQEKYINKNTFRYTLDGKYTKGGKTRWIYFERVLLEDMKRYFLTERRSIARDSGVSDGCLFIRSDKRFNGSSISESHGTRVFKKRARDAGLNPNLSYHDLRHTFATELFHSLLLNNQGLETRSQSAALIVVAQRLGHTFSRDGNAPSTTTRYIRMNIQMKEIEGGWDE